MVITEIGGVEFEINLFFLVLVLIYIWLGLLDVILIIFGLVFLHEMVHILVALRAGVGIKRLELLPFGGAAELEDEIAFNPGLEFVLAVSGPLSNLILCGLAWLLFSRGIITGENWLLFIRGNLYLGFFNLFPVLPLDGGRVMRALFTRRLGFTKATALFARLGIWAGILLVLGGLWGLFLYTRWLNLVLIGFFLIGTAARERNRAAYRFITYLTEKNEELKRKGILPADHIIAFEDTAVRELLSYLAPRRYHLVLLIDRNWQIKGKLTESRLIHALAERGGDVLLRDLFHSK